MKAFAIWLAGLVVVFGALAVVTNVVRSTERVFVVVDGSFPMAEVWSQVPGELDGLDDEKYSEFALATEKALVHDWEPSLTLVGVAPFAPCDFSGIESYSQVADADRLILLTTAASCDTTPLTQDWTVVRLNP